MKPRHSWSTPAALLIVVLTGCAGGTASPAISTTPPPTQSPSAAPTSPPTQRPTVSPSPTPRTPSTPSPSPRAEWPFVATMCPEATGGSLFLVALGTSETAGWGIRRDERYSPQAAYPALYADILCQELGVSVELHSYFPGQLSNQLAPLSWWSTKVAEDAALRADLAAANVVALWALSSHDVVAPMLSRACGSGSPEEIAACFADHVGDLTDKTDVLFASIADLVADDALVLAADAYALPFITGRSWWADPQRDDIRQVIDPYFAVSVAAPAHGFTFVDTELVFNGADLHPAADGLFQSDGLHPTNAGALLTAQTFAAADGLGE